MFLVGLKRLFEGKVTVLIAAGFKDGYRASDVLNTLQQRGFDWADDLDNAIVVRYTLSNQVKVQFRVDMADGGDIGWVRLWGSFLNRVFITSSSSVMLDIAEDLSGNKSHVYQILDANWWNEAFKLPSEFLRDVVGMIEPGDSAIFVFTKIDSSKNFLTQIRVQGGTPLHLALSDSQTARLREALAK